MSTQAKLLRVVQEREFKAVGDTRTQETNIRLITATNKDLKAMVPQGLSGRTFSIASTSFPSMYRR